MVKFVNVKRHPLYNWENTFPKVFGDRGGMLKLEPEKETLYLSTGELAKQLKVSVRTIRYYDQIGLSLEDSPQILAEQLISAI